MGTLGEVTRVGTPQKWGHFFLGKGLKKSVVKMLFRKGLSNPSLGYFVGKGLKILSKFVIMRLNNKM